MIDIIIPVFNCVEWTTRCLDSIARDQSAATRLIIIDNASTDATFSLISPRADVYIHNTKNLYVTKAWNQGLMNVTTADRILFLNNDLLVNPGTLKALEDALADDVHLAAVPDFDSALDPFHYSRAHKTVPCTHLTGPAFMLTRRCVEEIGIFDEQFVLVAQEDDYFFRMVVHSGAKAVTLAPGAMIRHWAGTSRKQLTKHAYMGSDGAKFQKKWKGKRPA